jgi:DNA mismatch endonuclease, patch repair protein
MTDVFSPSERSWIMAQVRSKGTRLEVRVQRALDALGAAYSTDGKALPGNPDIVLFDVKLAVFANGCFWHWHGCKRSRMPVTNREYWEAKIQRNVRRDRRTKRLLWAQGWHCCTIWECNVERSVGRLVGKIAALRK